MLIGPDDVVRDDDDEPETGDGTQFAVGPGGLKVTYHERGHRYYMNGIRAKGVSTVSKLAADDYNIRLWHERMVALGLTVEPEGRNIRENVAMHAENKNMLADLCEDAKKVAQAHFKADRGSQKHRVLELVLTGREHLLITDQQREDAVILKRTLDRYKLTPRADLVEQFVAYPNEYVLREICGLDPDDPNVGYLYICGRFDAVLAFETADNRIVLLDLKSGINAVKYPHSTACQLAMYNNAPVISIGEHRGDRIDVTEWGTMPDRLDHETGYVLLVENDGKVGTLHRLNIEHGWRAARMAMDMLVWRNAYAKGDNLVAEENDRFTMAAMSADTVEELRQIWADARKIACLTEELKMLIHARRDELQKAAKPKRQRARKTA